MIQGSSQNNGAGHVGVVLASASAVRRAGLEAMVKSAPSLKLIASIPGTQTAAARALELRADVVLADLERPSLLPIQGPLAVAAVVLVDNPEPGWTAQALRSGVKAILPRDAGAEDMIPAVIAACAGFVFLDPACARNLAQQVRAPMLPSGPANEHLTPRELEVLGMLAEGLGNREIAGRLGVSDHTVKFHISSILDKLGAATRTEAVTLGLRLGLILL
jgi:two-component system, NarL family, response regulator YdfI